MKIPTNKLVLKKKKAKILRVKFTSTKATQKAADDAARCLGYDILESIAKELGTDRKACFEAGGSPTEQAHADIFALGCDGAKFWLETYLFESRLDRDVLNEMRLNMELPPLA